jgi:phosphoglycerate dehydrogenase-like enzyme
VHDLDAAIAEADVISLHLPLDETTRHVIDARRLALMRPSAILLNTARGGLIDEAALAAALPRGASCVVPGSTFSPTSRRRRTIRSWSKRRS